MKNILTTYYKILPVLAVYFFTGMAALSSVSNTLFITKFLSLSAAELAGLGIYVGLPWSMKPVIGQLVDRFGIRSMGIYFGQLLILAGGLFYIDMVSYQLIPMSEYALLLTGGFLATLGVVVSDIVADVQAIEHADNDEEVKAFQVASRIAIIAGGLVAASITGFLAANYTIAEVFLLEVTLPLVVMILVAVGPDSEADGDNVLIDKTIMSGGLIFGATAIVSGLFLGDYGQLTTAIVGSTLLGGMMLKLLKTWNPEAKKNFLLVMAAIFLFRIAPGVGPSGSWWLVNDLKFSPEFLGNLRFVGSIASLVVALAFGKLVKNSSVFSVMTFLTISLTLLGLPEILVYYNDTAREFAKSILMFDTALSLPLINLTMIPIGILIARSAPTNQAGTYLTVAAGIMNIALVAGNVIEQQLNRFIVVTRNDFSEFGNLLLSSQGISLVLSIIGLLLIYKGTRNPSNTKYE